MVRINFYLLGHINKFKCLNQLYMYEIYCPSNFIKLRKFNEVKDSINRSNFTQDQLDLINFRKNNIETGKIKLN